MVGGKVDKGRIQDKLSSLHCRCNLHSMVAGMLALMVQVGR